MVPALVVDFPGPVFFLAGPDRELFFVTDPKGFLAPAATDEDWGVGIRDRPEGLDPCIASLFVFPALLLPQGNCLLLLDWIPIPSLAACWANKDERRL